MSSAQDGEMETTNLPGSIIFNREYCRCRYPGHIYQHCRALVHYAHQSMEDIRWQYSPRVGQLPCLCGHPNHLYSSCHVLNPYVRRQMWEIREPAVNRVNQKLHDNPKLRPYILSLGYEYYRPISKPFREPTNPLAQLGRLPIEMKCLILEWTYAITVDELPESHPMLGLYLDGQRNGKHGPVPTVVNLPTPYRSGSWRRDWLARHRGKWGPLFKVMYVSKQFYEIGKPIRYREVHFSFITFNRDLVCSQLSTVEVLKEATERIHLNFHIGSGQPINDLVTALGTLPKLKHVCVTLLADTSHQQSILRQYTAELCQFLDLKVKTFDLHLGLGWN